MWPPSSNAFHRLRARIMTRLGYAQQVHGTYERKEHAPHNLRLLGPGLLSCRDDPVLYTHWTGAAPPRILTRANDLEERLWEHLGSTIATLYRSGYLYAAFTHEATWHRDAITGLEETLTSQLYLVPDPEDALGADLLTRAIEHTKHYLTTP